MRTTCEVKQRLSGQRGCSQCHKLCAAEGATLEATVPDALSLLFSVPSHHVLVEVHASRRLVDGFRMHVQFFAKNQGQYFKACDSFDHDYHKNSVAWFQVLTKLQDFQNNGTQIVCRFLASSGLSAFCFDWRHTSCRKTKMQYM